MSFLFLISRRVLNPGSLPMRRIISRLCSVLCVASALAAAEPDRDQLQQLHAREQWTTSRVVGFPEPPPPYVARPAYPELKLTKPLAVGRFPAGNLMWITTHTDGYGGPSWIHLFADEPAAASLELFVERPEIIFGVAFHPDFVNNRYVFLGGNGPSELLKEKATRVLRFTVTRDAPYRIEPESATLILEWASDGHNGGDLAFGPDGMLYISSGDGTSDSDPKEAGQNMGILNAKLLRIDVDHAADGQPYSVPTDNPFVGREGMRPETWAYGFRNPWRITYDHTSNQLWVGNNGQDLWESAHLVRKGENYGWSVMEGSHPFQLQRQPGPTPFVPPTIEHHHSEARSLTGGVVYRGELLPDLEGVYIYGDYSTGNIWGAKHDGEKLTRHELLARSTIQISGFAVNARGELLIVDHLGGIFSMVPRPPDAPHPPFPTKLSETGVYADVQNQIVAQGLIPYDVNSPLWSDGAAKQRFIGLSDVGQIEFNDKESWDFPDGTVLVKTFSLPTVDNTGLSPVETRLMTRQDGQWYGYSYEWNDKLTDAVLVPAAGKDREYVVQHAGVDIAERQTWHFPSRSECMVCHSRAAKFVLGLSAAQMNREFDYENTGNPVNQLLALEHWSVFKSPQSDSGEAKHFQLSKPIDELPRLANPYDNTQPLENRVRAYLDSNCATCHVEAGGGNSLMDLSAKAPLDKMRLLDIIPQHDRLGVEDARLIAPGDPERSILLKRMEQRGRGQMPPLATSRVDAAATMLLREWIASLPK